MAENKNETNPNTNHDEIKLPQSIIDSFARFLVPIICEFYESEERQKALIE